MQADKWKQLRELFHEALDLAPEERTEYLLVELEKSFNERGYYTPLLRVDPLMDPLRDDPRFADLMKRIGLPK